MSRGLGRTQRFVLDFLEERRGYQSAYDIAAAMTGVASPSPSAVQSVRQAIRRLEDWGLVEAKTFQSDREGLPLRWEPGSRRFKNYEREQYIRQLPWGERSRRRHYLRQPDRRMLHVWLTPTEEQQADEAAREFLLDAHGGARTLGDLAAFLQATSKRVA